MKTENDLLKKEIGELEATNLEYMESIAKLVSSDNKNQNTILNLRDRVAQLESSIHHQIFKERVVEDPTNFSQGDKFIRSEKEWELIEVRPGGFYLMKSGDTEHLVTLGYLKDNFTKSAGAFKVEVGDEELTRLSKIVGDSMAKDFLEEKKFSSRFMPNVKFRVPKECADKFKVFVGTETFGYTTSPDGEAIYNLSCIGASEEEGYSVYPFKEVSIYEAIPELEPDGFVSLKTEGGVEALVSEHVWEAMRRNNSSDSHQSFSERLTKPLSDIVKKLYGDDVHILDNIQVRFTPDRFKLREVEHTITFTSVKKS